MKKFLFLASAALVAMTMTTSCNKAGGNASAEDKAFGDSVAVALGEFAGGQAATSLQHMRDMQPEMAEKFKKEAFLRGVKTILDADTTDMAYFQGLQMGLQLINPIIGINNEAQIPVNKDKVMAAFKQTYMADSIADMNELYANYQALMTALQARVKAREDARIANSPEAQANLAEGLEYQAQMEAAGYTRSESGILYMIENPGTDPKVGPRDKATIAYTGKNVKGEVFDSNAENPTEMRAGSFIPGFNEALQLLGKGGKLTVVIPADQAYGLQGAGEKIGPNQTLVFDIEVLVVNPAN